MRMFGNDHEHFNALLPPKQPSLLRYIALFHSESFKHSTFTSLQIGQSWLDNRGMPNSLHCCWSINHDLPVQYGAYNGKFSFGVTLKSGKGWCSHPTMTSKIPASIACKERNQFTQAILTADSAAPPGKHWWWQWRLIIDLFMACTYEFQEGYESLWIPLDRASNGHPERQIFCAVSHSFWKQQQVYYSFFHSPFISQKPSLPIGSGRTGFLFHQCVY